MLEILLIKWYKILYIYKINMFQTLFKLKIFTLNLLKLQFLTLINQYLASLLLI